VSGNLACWCNVYIWATAVGHFGVLVEAKSHSASTTGCRGEFREKVGSPGSRGRPVRGSPMRKLSTSCWGAAVTTTALLLCRCAWAQVPMARLLEVAREELRDAGVSEKEIQVRLKIVEDVATVKAYYPHADGGRPEKRNPRHWELNEAGSYIPRGSATQAIRDLWRTESGIRCKKLSRLVMIKALIDVADEKRLAELDDMLRGKVIPNELRDGGVGTLFVKPDPKDGEVFQRSELLPGDQIWFENPYFERLSRSQQRRYIGQEGHHVFYIGGGKVMDMYSRKPLTIEVFRRTFLRWKSVRLVAERDKLKPKAAEFQIKAVRRVMIDGA
jgi:Protein-glutamine gamma-glutamyltransferase